MAGRTLARFSFWLTIASATAACGGAAQSTAVGSHDMPVPAGEARAEMRLRLDLAAAQGCEEAFDLALYKDRGVDLVMWDDHTGSCSGRVVTIRYLPKRTSAQALMAAVRGLAIKVENIPAK